MGYFFGVLTTTYFIEHKELTIYTVCVQMLSFLYLPQPKNPGWRKWRRKTGQPSH